MSTASPAIALQRRLVLGDVLPGARVRDALLVLAGALLTVLGAQIAIPVPPSPVPITGQTLAVVIAGAALGANRGALSQLLYLTLGLFLPVFSDGGQGIDVIWGATGGYLIGFVAAAYVIGKLAEHGADRKPALAFLSFVLGQLIVFGIGVPWLKVSAGIESWGSAIHDGFTIFIIGGLIKAIVAAACAMIGLPTSGASMARAPTPTGGDAAPGRSSRDTARLAAIGILTAVAALFAVLNLEEVKVNLLFGSATMPLIIVIVACLAIGFALGTALSRRRRSRRRD
jgi:biotin transport system substrate-specific component